MKKTNHHLIAVPLEFKVACTIYKVTIQEVLQVFIDHITLYDSICLDYSEGFYEATRTIFDFIIAKQRKPKQSSSLSACRDMAVNCTKKIIALAKKKTGEHYEKRKDSQLYVTSIYMMMEHNYAPTDLIYLDENTTLRLSKDFCVICELNSCYPKEFLEDFMNRVSLADCHARQALKIKNPNIAMCLFMKIANGFARDNSVMLQLRELELDFYQRMEEMRLELYIIRNLQERTAALQDFYFSHYQQMNA